MKLLGRMASHRTVSYGALSAHFPVFSPRFHTRTSHALLAIAPGSSARLLLILAALRLASIRKRYLDAAIMCPYTICGSFQGGHV